jgi:hypothetical protein
MDRSFTMPSIVIGCDLSRAWLNIHAMPAKVAPTAEEGAHFSGSDVGGARAPSSSGRCIKRNACADKGTRNVDQPKQGANA